MNEWYKLIQLECHKDVRGSLCVIESENVIPFKIRRVFYDYGNIDCNYSRGNHANRFSKFGIVSISGSCSILINNGKEQRSILLDSPEKMLYIDKMVWKEIKSLSQNNIILVLSDGLYNADEYIRDFNVFLDEINKKQ